MRNHGYYGCIASVIGGPSAVAICYGIVVNKIENEYIPELRAKVQAI